MPRKKIEASVDSPKSKQNNDTEVIVDLPNEIPIKLVPANELGHYEVFFGLAGLFSTTASGFWVAYANASSVNSASRSLLWSATAFTIFTIVFIVAAIWYRNKLKHKSVQKKASLKDFK